MTLYQPIKMSLMMKMKKRYKKARLKNKVKR